MHNPPTGQHQPVKTKHRRRWPWITGAAVLAFFMLIGIFSNKPQTTGTPTVGTVGTVATASATSSAPTTTPTTTVDVPVTTTTVADVVAPPVVTTVPEVVVAPRTTYQAAPKPPPVVAPPPVAPPPVVAPPVVPPAPVTGKYHAGEFCKTVGATAISTTGAPMTCLQEGKYKRWHND